MITINEECYIGSTFDFNQRMIKHKTRCYNENSKYYNYKIYKYIRANGGWNNVNISIIDVYYLVNRKFKNETEQYYMDYFQSGLNSNKAFTGLERKEYLKEYRKNNVEKTKEYQKQWYKNNTEKIKQKYEDNKGKIKQYYEDNKGKIKQQQKKYRNKRVNCPLCKKEMNRGSLSKHIKNSCKMNLK